MKTGSGCIEDVTTFATHSSFVLTFLTVFICNFGGKGLYDVSLVPWLRTLTVPAHYDLLLCALLSVCFSGGRCVVAPS